MRSAGLLVLLVITTGAGGSPALGAASPTAVFKPYRFDDEFKPPPGAAAGAAVRAAFLADPIVWHNFLSEDDITWGLLRGQIGYRKGDLIVKGDGSTPVIAAKAHRVPADNPRS